VLEMAAILRALVLLMFGALIIQLINLQVINGEEYQERAAINALREVPVPAARGLIYDRNGQPLVENSARFSVTLTPGDLPDRGVAAVYRSLSNSIGMPVEEIEAKVEEGIKKQGEFAPTVIKTDLPRDTALVLMELEPHTPGMHVSVDPARRYLSGDLLSQILGYVGPLSAEEYAVLEADGYRFQDYIGKTGVEGQYEDALRGTDGKKLIEVDALGRELSIISEKKPVDGSNVVLSLDLELQREMTTILQEYAGESLNAAAVMMDVKTGEVLGMVSLPTFDNNVFSSNLSQEELTALINAPGKPLVNHAIAERYPPGSTFKTIVGSGALQEGVAYAGTTITSRGYITIENEFDPNVVYVYPDWAPLGTLDFYDGLAMSSNVYFYYLSGGFAEEGFRGLGEERVAKYARGFGLGGVTGIDLPGESEGLVPDAEWKQETLQEPWALGDTYNFGIGQGYVAATPMQMVVAASAIANGGQLLTPHVVKEYRDSLGNVLQPIETTVHATVPVDDANLDIVRTGMRQSVTSGVARNAAISNVAIAGKTGTAEFGEIGADGKYPTHGWFIGFAPYDDPQVALVVFVERGSGGFDASPAASRMFDFYFNGTRLPEGQGDQGPVTAPEDEPIQAPGPLDVTGSVDPEAGVPVPTDAPASPGVTDAPETATPVPETPPPETEPPVADTPPPTEAPQAADIDFRRAQTALGALL
jgi:penicillin-binding protein 2